MAQKVVAVMDIMEQAKATMPKKIDDFTELITKIGIVTAMPIFIWLWMGKR